MKKIKLGFIAIALLGAATAFATNVTSNGLPECSQANVSTICEPGDEDCCIATEQLTFDGKTYQASETVQGFPL